MRRLTHALAIWLLSVSLAAAQTGVGQIANGNLLANATGSTAAARDTTPTAWFDQAYCNTIGNLIVRFTGAWTCSQASPANPVWWGADPAGTNDSSPALTSALAASTNIFFPAGTYKFNSQISVSLASGVHSLKITCAGQDNTILNWPTTNGIVVTYADATNNSTHIDGCTFTTGAANTSAGLTLQFLGTNTNPANTALNEIIRSTFRGSDGYAATNLWNIAIKIVSVSNVNLIGVNVVGGNVSSYANSSTSGTGLSLLGTALANSVAINVSSSIFDYLTSGIIYGTGVQGVTVMTSQFTGGYEGIVVPAGDVGLDQFAIIGSQFNDAVAGIISNSPMVNMSIANNLFIIDVASGFGAVLSQYATTTVVGNFFQCGTLTGTNGLVFTTPATQAASTVTGNVFYNCGAGLLLGAAATQLVIVGNNFEGNALSPGASSGNQIAYNMGYNPVGYTAAISTGTSASVITAGQSPETHYITQSANFNAVVAKCTLLACGTSTNLCTVPSATVPCVIYLGPNESYKVTWVTTQPTYTKDIH